MPLPMFQEKPLHPPMSGVRHIIAIAAGKGGVGKSTVTVNMALALKHLGFSVGLLDADLYGPSMRHLMPEQHAPEQKGKKILPALSQGIPFISMAYFRPDNEVSAVRAPIANNIIGQFIKDVEWGNLDYLLIDFPPGTGDIQLTLAQQAQLTGAIMITTPQEVALLDVRKAMRLFYHVRVPILGVVENMSYLIDTQSHQKMYLFGQGGGANLAQQNAIPLLGEIPIDPQLCRLADQGKNLFYPFQDESATVQVFLEAARHLANSSMHASNQKYIALKQLQKETHSLKIEWTDGSHHEYRFSELQKNCPCAECREAKNRCIDENVGVRDIQQVGRYAIRMQFTSGCSKGLYEFEMLRKMKE